MRKMWWFLALALLLPAGAQDGDIKGQKQAPKKLSDPKAWNVGRKIDNHELGEAGKLSNLLTNKKFLVLAWTAVDCPVSRLYRPKTERLEKRYRSKDVQFVYVYCVPGDKPDASADFPVYHDKDGKLTKAFKATRTTDIFILDAKRTLRYRGAIDDQYGIGYKKDKAKKFYFVDALDALLKDRDVPVSATEAPG